jgi:hypothetical protein
MWDQCLVLNISEVVGTCSVSDTLQCDIDNRHLTRGNGLSHGIDVLEINDEMPYSEQMVRDIWSHSKHSTFNNTAMYGKGQSEDNSSCFTVRLRQ